LNASVGEIDHAAWSHRKPFVQSKPSIGSDILAVGFAVLLFADRAEFKGLGHLFVLPGLRPLLPDRLRFGLEKADLNSIA
jgi:hypothetical protein